MLRTLCLGFAAAALLGLPASAATMVVMGSGPANFCYNAALHNRADTEAVRQCSDAIDDSRLTPADRAATYVNRGIVNTRRHDLDQAIADFDAAAGIAPDLAEAYTNRGIALVARHDYAGARIALNRALELNPDDPAKAYYGRAIANEELGDVREAYADYRQAAELAPHWDAPRAELARFRVEPHG